jgi:protein-disulfide isomerase
MGKRQEIRDRRRKEQLGKRLLWTGAGVIILAVILALALPYFLSGNTRIAAADLTQPPEKPFPQAEFNRLGNPDAPVKVVEFADYLCSHCQVFALIEERPFIERYVASGQVHFEYLSVALTRPEQTQPIEATYCAGDQGAFWEYRDLVYANIAENPNALNDNYLTAYAEALGLNTGDFNNCIRSGKHRSLIQETLGKARDAGIPGTPTFLVNGAMATRLDLSQVVDSELAKIE